ncbi:hypothetical protein Syn7502_00737 [Synechococcus sp. PCC 7502]|uniref:hypothetical protein n=1 Tax=Synechococcus sp. PCC 7502 TaxID=1173263 RepID=UPI00029FA43F|nr:hypothetical protein [Synechococcus sp. PCC 7502]AFY72871.1 hypothetical protein Syn7502_00737 [Synechococcus sp. PCC 7502]
MRRFYRLFLVVYSLLWVLPAHGDTSSKCPDSFQDLAISLSQDLPSYLNRTYTRLKINQQAIVASLPDLNPLPLVTGDRNLPSPSQMFISVLSGKVGQTKSETHPYWLFIVKTEKGWRLAMAFTKTGNAPIQDISDGAIADATSTWLRDRCH